jgi:hypothetical protein
MAYSTNTLDSYVAGYAEATTISVPSAWGSEQPRHLQGRGRLDLRLRESTTILPDDRDDGNAKSMGKGTDETNENGSGHPDRSAHHGGRGGRTVPRWDLVWRRGCRSRAWMRFRQAQLF